MQRTDSCVFSLVTAFTSGLDVFKKFRGRKHKKKSKRAQVQAAASLEKTGEELRLSKSLRRGTADIRGEYEKHYSGYGERFAVGDPIAQASLCETLLKFNSGLVDIISSFLRSSRKDLHLDYQSLISLSDTSRNEALNALNRLSQRLSRSNLSLIPHPRHCPQCGRSAHDGPCLRKAASTDQLNKKKAAKAASTGAPAKPAADKAQHIRKMQLCNASAPQLVLVKPRRPHARRATSASSAGASPPPSYKSSPPQSPPPASPTAYWPPPQQQQQQQSPPLAPAPAYGPAPPRYSAATPPAVPPPLPRKPTAYRGAKLAAAEPTARRRAAKMTPSLYTFASDSTKLGEIPMDRWNVPFDWGAAERGNREAALGVAAAAPQPPQPERRGLLRGLFSWRKA